MPLTVPSLERDWTSARVQIQDTLQKMPIPCYYKGLGAGVPQGNWYGIAFPNGKPERCPFIAVVLDDNSVYFSMDSGVTWFNVYTPSVVLPNLYQAGSVIPWGGNASTPPSGWLIANGQAVSRSTYSDLFTRIGTTYGVGDGSTTFNVPDLRGVTPLMVNNNTTPNLADGAYTTRNIANTGGVETHTLVEGEYPSHNHTRVANSSASNIAPSGGTQGIMLTGGNDHDNTGADGSHTNEQPYLTFVYLIKT